MLLYLWKKFSYINDYIRIFSPGIITVNQIKFHRFALPVSRIALLILHWFKINWRVLKPVRMQKLLLTLIQTRIVFKSTAHFSFNQPAVDKRSALNSTHLQVPCPQPPNNQRLEKPAFMSSYSIFQWEKFKMLAFVHFFFGLLFKSHIRFKCSMLYFW